MSVPSLLTILVGIILFGGGLVLLARVVRPWRGGDQVLVVFLAVVVSVLGLAIGWLGITLNTESTAPQPSVPQPTATAPALPTSTAPPATARPTMLPPRVSPVPTIVLTTPRPTPPPPTVAAPAPTASTSSFGVLLAQARAHEERAGTAANRADQLSYLRQAEVIARALLASNPCEYTLQALFIRICRTLSLLDPAAAACANAPICASG